MERLFGIVETVVIRDPRISVGAKALYSLLCSYTTPGRPYAYPSTSELCEHLGDIHLRTLRRYISELKQFRYIDRRKTSNGWIYELVLKQRNN
jgi:hypothetical protein